MHKPNQHHCSAATVQQQLFGIKASPSSQQPCQHECQHNAIPVNTRTSDNTSGFSSEAEAMSD